MGTDAGGTHSRGPVSRALRDATRAVTGAAQVARSGALGGRRAFVTPAALPGRRVSVPLIGWVDSHTAIVVSVAGVQAPWYAALARNPRAELIAAWRHRDVVAWLLDAQESTSRLAHLRETSPREHERLLDELATIPGAQADGMRVVLLTSVERAHVQAPGRFGVRSTEPEAI